jgi:hypothetical protein
MDIIIEVRLEWDNKLLVSSANRIGTDLSLINIGKSFINMRKSKGPKTEPWETPCSLSAHADVVIFTVLIIQ